MQSLDNDVFDTAFLRRHMMGPNCVRLAGELLDGIDLAPCRRVLDLGCGQGLTSLFLAQKTEAQIFAFDLWIDATDNFQRFAGAARDDRIIPVHGQAEDLPFAHGYFDALLSVDAYFYFGVAPDFLDTRIAPFLAPGATIAIAVPGLKKDFTDGVPEVLQPFWQEDINFYSVAWWTDLFSKAESVRLDRCFSMAGHEAAWRDWLACDNEYAKRDIEMMRAENGQYFDTIGILATVR